MCRIGTTHPFKFGFIAALGVITAWMLVQAAQNAKSVIVMIVVAMFLAVGLGMLLMLSISLSSHAAADPDPILPVLSDWVHLLAVSAWVGGLTHFAAALWATRRSRVKSPSISGVELCVDGGMKLG